MSTPVELELARSRGFEVGRECAAVVPRLLDLAEYEVTPWVVTSHGYALDSALAKSFAEGVRQGIRQGHKDLDAL